MALERVTLLQNKRIVLGVTGSIAAYKAVDLASKLTQLGALVDVIMTDAAQRFVTALTFEAVTGRAVYSDLWRTASGSDLPTHVAHVGLAEGADLLVIAPATADTLARLAHGRANDLLAITALAARCPVLVAPAMDGSMYAHAATQANVATLAARGVVILPPEEGRFASGLVGAGRLPETATLIGAIRLTLGREGVLKGRRVVVTAGGTREALDPVRYLTNRSSGKQGYALAQAALDAGAEVTLISAARLETPYGAQLIAVESAQAMHAAVMEQVASADGLLMAAAVADFRPKATSAQKIKKSDELTIELQKNPDILLAVAEQRRETRSPLVVVGFAAESQKLADYARDKLERKGLDLLIANDISAADAGFELDSNRVLIFERDENNPEEMAASKAKISEAIIERVAKLLAR
ncbi:MAG: bifunctional phosphopantothenoylcysteine decarboxylase/phosphopantothenate--cysteine ligase CoaBC [Chloroflexota bacterium]